MQDYINGEYDRECESCKGSGKIKVLDRDRVPVELLRLYDLDRQIDADMAAMERAERAFGC